MKNKHYVGEFSEWKDVRENYGDNCPEQEPRYVFAEYEQGGYEGSSTVITSMNARAFSVVEGSHCSCFGLEGQWQPTEHTVTDLKKMMEASYGFFHDQRDRIAYWLDHMRR